MRKPLFKYFKVVADFEGQTDVLYSSYVRSECQYELKAERDGWRNEGYKRIRIEVELTPDKPDPDVYTERQLVAIRNNAQ